MMGTADETLQLSKKVWTCRSIAKNWKHTEEDLFDEQKSSRLHVSMD